MRPFCLIVRDRAGRYLQWSSHAGRFDGRSDRAALDQTGNDLGTLTPWQLIHTAIMLERSSIVKGQRLAFLKILGGRAYRLEAVCLASSQPWLAGTPVPSAGSAALLPACVPDTSLAPRSALGWSVLGCSSFLRSAIS